MTNQEQHNADALERFRTLVDWVLLESEDLGASAFFKYGEDPQWWYASRALRETALNCKKQLPKVEVAA
jgi:hypothetical protein